MHNMFYVKCFIYSLGKLNILTMNYFFDNVHINGPSPLSDFGTDIDNSLNIITLVMISV